MTVVKYYSRLNNETMKKIFFALLPFIIALFAISCDELNVDPSLTDEELIEGLKTALNVGTDSSTAELSAVNGYYLDKFVKIPLPDEAEEVRTVVVQLQEKAPSLSSFIDLDDEFENVVKSINKAAEESAKEAAPIFGGAIKSLTIKDGWDILNGKNPADKTKADAFDSTAATAYFKTLTSGELTQLYAPKINVALDKDLGVGLSANEAWNALRNAVNSSVDKITSNNILNLAYENSGISIPRIETESIGEFATEKALDGLFLKVGEEEKKIRNNPFDWALDILRKVFG